MNIYFIGQKGIPAQGGGVERHVEELATRLAQSGQAVFAYARQRYTGSDVETYKGVNILYTPAIYTKHLEAISHTFFSVLDLVRRDADVIHVHAIGPSLLIPLIRILKPRAKVVATIHCADYNHQKWGAFARFSLRLGERIAAQFSHVAITVSHQLKQQMKDRYNVIANYIPNGVNRPQLGADATLLQEWGLEPNAYIVSISRLIRHKGLHFLIEAYKQIKTDKKLVIVGGAEYTDEYVRELHELSAGNPNIIFTDKQSGAKLAALFEHAYLFVQPSLSEGLSIALLEALSYRQAVLASDIPENKEVVEGVSAQFRAGDVQDLKNQLQSLLDHPQRVAELKETGIPHVARFYDWGHITDQTLNLYRAVTAPDFQHVVKLAKQAS